MDRAQCSNYSSEMAQGDQLIKAEEEQSERYIKMREYFHSVYRGMARTGKDMTVFALLANKQVSLPLFSRC